MVKIFTYGTPEVSANAKKRAPEFSGALTHIKNIY